MGRLTQRQRDAAYWNRKHAKGIASKFIECAYWACQYNSVLFNEQTGWLRNTMCTRCNKNLNYWTGLNAPSWCPRRKANGGTI